MKFVIATFRVRPESKAEFIQVLQRCRMPTLKEPECLEFDVLTSTTDPQKVVVVEAFKTAGGHTEHIKTPQVAAVQRDAFPLAAEKTFQNIFADRVEVDHG